MNGELEIGQGSEKVWAKLTEAGWETRPPGLAESFNAIYPPEDTVMGDPCARAFQRVVEEYGATVVRPPDVTEPPEGVIL